MPRNKTTRVYYAINLKQINKCEDIIHKICEMLNTSNQQYLSKRLEAAFENLLMCHMQLEFNGLTFDVTTDDDEHIGQGSLNAREMECIEIFNMEYWIKTIDEKKADLMRF